MQPFAPTPYLSEPLSVGINLNEPVRLATNARERDLYDTLSVIFSILVSLEFLEKAYVRDTITIDLYQERCARLISQYYSGTTHLSGSPEFKSVEDFCTEYKLSYPLALARLKEGKPAGQTLDLVLPATVQVATPSTTATTPSASSTMMTTTTTTTTATAAAKRGTSAAKVAETVQNFITLMDALKLSFRAKDQLHPLLSDLMSSLTTQEESHGDEDEEEDDPVDPLPGKAKIVKWLIRINQMKVSEEITEEEARELFFELEGLYGEYLKTL